MASRVIVVTWKRNLFAVTAASFIGFTGFTLVMPFLPLYFRQLGVQDVGDIAVWSGISLGVTPAITAILSPFWGRLADRYGRKIMVERSLASFVVIMALMAYVTRAWHVLALRIVQGLFAGYGSLSLTMAADSAPPDRMPYAIGFVQTAQRLGPAVGPLIGGTLAQFLGLRPAFIVTALFYLAACVIVFLVYDERAAEHLDVRRPQARVTFRNVLAFENFILLMGVIFGLQVVDRSFGPVLPLYVVELGTPPDRVAIVSGVLFSISAATAAIGHHLCGRLLRRGSARRVIAASVALAAAGATAYLIAADTWPLMVGTPIFGIALGVATTAAYTAAGSVMPGSARGAGFGLLTTASLAGLAISPIISGILGATSIRAVFLLDVIALGALAAIVSRVMIAAPLLEASAPATEEM
jgi:MFS transporter, DHA1 family, multidrug resistance protein